MAGVSQVLDFGLGLTGNEWFNHERDEAAEGDLLLLYELCVHVNLQGKLNESVRSLFSSFSIQFPSTLTQSGGCLFRSDISLRLRRQFVPISCHHFKYS